MDEKELRGKIAAIIEGGRGSDWDYDEDIGEEVEIETYDTDNVIEEMIAFLKENVAQWKK